MKEAGILRDCIELLRILKMHRVLDYWRITVGGVLRQGMYLIPNKEMAGFSDIIILTKNPYSIFLETKSPKGRQSDNQKEFQRRVESVGHKYYLCRSREHLCQILTENGIETNRYISSGSGSLF